MKKLLLTSCIATALLASTSAFAVENEAGLYVGGNYGYVKVDGDDDFDDDNDMKQAIIGLRLNPYIGLEGSYIDFGKYGSSAANASTDGYTAALKLTAPIADRIDLYAKGGQLWYDTDYEFAGVSGSEDDTAVFAGAGIGFKLAESLLLNVEYTWYDVDLDANQVVNGANSDTDLRQASIGIEYRF